MSLIDEFIKEYKRTYTYTEQKCMYEKYLEMERIEGKYYSFFSNVNNLFLHNFSNAEEIPSFGDLETQITDVIDAEEKIFKESCNYFEAKKLILTKKSAELLKKLTNPTSDLLWTVKGEAYLEMGKTRNVKEAEDCFRKAIKENEKYALAHLGLAISLFIRYKDIANDEIEQALKKAEKFGAKAQVEEQRGYMHQQYGNLDESISHYEKAIDWDPCMMMALRFLKSYYCDSMQSEKALHILERARTIMPDNDPDINFLIGSLYLKKREYDVAKKFLKDASDRYKLFNDLFYESLSAELLAEIQADEGTCQKLQNSQNSVAKVLWRTISKKVDYTVFHNKEKFLNFISPKLFNTVSQDITLEVLRRWNSYTPIIADNYYASRGGGYFIKIKGKGIVIDPGFNFIDNFKEAGHKFHEIDAILITHAHNDHTADLESILTLLSKYNKELKGKETFNRENTVRADMAMFYNYPITYDEPDFKRDCEIEFEESRKKIIDLFITKSTMDKYNGLFNLRSDKDYRIHIIEAEFHEGQQSKVNYKGCDKIKFDGSRINIVDTNNEECAHIRVISAKHDDIISDRDSVGFVIEFEKVDSVLIFTGDTGWNNKIKEQYARLSKEYKNDRNQIILIAHIGGFSMNESKYDPDADIETQPFYEHHLGRLGLASLIETLEPDYCFISEFGEEFNGKRIELAEIFQDAFKDKDIVILPVDNGFKYDVINDKANAVVGVDPDNCQIIKGYIELKDIGVSTLYKDYSLQYFKKRGEKSVNESDVMQVLSFNFEKKRF